MVRVRVKKCSLLVGLSLLLGANIVYILFHPGIVFISKAPAQELNSYHPTPLSLVTPVKPVENQSLFETNLSSTVVQLRSKEQIPLFNGTGLISRKKREEDDKDFSGPGETPPSEGRNWYLSGGWKLPTPKRSGLPRTVWPGEAPGSDRIKAQLMFIPPESQIPKRILVYNGLASWGQTKPGQAAFQGCPVSTCHLTTDKSESVRADAILYKDHFVHPGHPKQHRQVWILYMLECPYHTQHMKYNDVFNWTATYRWDSDIVTPYEKWVYHDENIKQLPKPIKDFAANKTKQVAWFVSNCGARNSRLQYAHELQKFIGVDIFGACGTKKCPRSTQFKCFSMLDQNYKFYLAFENSNCKDYITEKFFVNGLGRNILPIVMGARKEDYERAAPLRSFIHVDDFASPKELAEYLHKLDNDDNLYNDYFRWKGTGEFINTFFFCRLCAMLHDNYPSKSYRDINEWWRGPGTCTSASWKPKINWFQSMAIKA